MHATLACTGGSGRFFAHLPETLHAIDFHKGCSAKTIEQRFRHLFHCATPDARELRVLHGVLADAERMASLAGQSAGDEN